MDTRRSFCLLPKLNDFAEPDAAASGADTFDIFFVKAVNDNVRTRDRLSSRCGSLLRRLIALHSLNWPDSGK
jgi:hypothetical protein